MLGGVSDRGAAASPNILGFMWCTLVVQVYSILTIPIIFCWTPPATIFCCCVNLVVLDLVREENIHEFNWLMILPQSTNDHFSFVVSTPLRPVCLYPTTSSVSNIGPFCLVSIVNSKCIPSGLLTINTLSSISAMLCVSTVYIRTT